MNNVLIVLISLISLFSCNVLDSTLIYSSDGSTQEKENICEVHNIKMRKGFSKASYGKLYETYSCQLEFPNADCTKVLTRLTEKQSKAYQIKHLTYKWVKNYICQECNKMRKEYLKQNKDYFLQ